MFSEFYLRSFPYFLFKGIATFIVAFRILYTSGRFEIIIFKKRETPRKPFIFVLYLNSSISRQICTGKIFRMPDALTETQRMMVEALLKGKTPHTKVAEEVKCSVAQVKKMSMNWNKYGSVVAPKFGKRGMPSIVTCEMRDV